MSAPGVSDQKAPDLAPDQDAPARGVSVEARHWGWRHGGRKAWALQGIDCSIRPGEKVLLVGASGAGKSTLLHGLCGLLDTEEGEARGDLLVDGGPAPTAAKRGRVGLVQQDPESQICMERVGDEVAFGLENLGVRPTEIWQRVAAALTAVDLSVANTHSTSELSGGQKQRMAIAAAIAMHPGLLLLDEPTANLDPDGTAAIRDCVANVQGLTGATTIVVEHKLDPWIDFADRMIVLGAEGIVADGPPRQVLDAQRDALLAAGVWVPGCDPVIDEASEASNAQGSLRDLGAEPLDTESAPTGLSAESLKTLATPEIPALETHDLAVGYVPNEPVLADVNLRVSAGKSVCIVGPNAAGKSTLALTMAGLLDPLAGTVVVADAIRHRDSGRDLPPDPAAWKPQELLGRVSMVFQEPGYQFVTNTVRTELALGPKQMGLPDSEVQDRVQRTLQVLGLESLADANPFTLSGGERRRLSVASALVSAPKLLILDEPTFGQDRNTWIGLVKLLREVVNHGTTVISVTHDELFVRALGDQVIRVGAEVAATPAAQSQLNAPVQKTAAQEIAAQNPQPDSGGPEHRRVERRTGTANSFHRQKLGPARESRSAAHARMRATPAPIGRVNPVIQVLGIILMTVPLIVTVDWVSALVALVLESLLIPLLGLRPRQVLKRIALLLAIAPVTAISLLLYGDPEGAIYWSWGPAIISQNSVELAVAIALRVLAIGVPCVLVLSQIDPIDMADGMIQVLHMPARIVFSSVAGLRMATLMGADWQALRRARRSRGMTEGNPVRSFFRGAFSLLVFALQRATTLSLTMEARGFGGAGPRSNARESRTSKVDALALLGCVAVPAIALASAVWAGEFRWFGI